MVNIAFKVTVQLIFVKCVQTILKDAALDLHIQYEYNGIHHLLKSFKLSKEYMDTLKEREAKLSDEIVLNRLVEVIEAFGDASIFLLNYNIEGPNELLF